MPPRGEIDIDALADQLTAILEGGIIISKAHNDRAVLGQQTRLYRNYVKLIFGA